jgi:hypothetical protein
MKLYDYPMSCCGMVEAGGIQARWDYSIDNYHQSDWDTLFGHIEKHQLDHRRNCAMISLSTQQRHAQEEAVKRGWVKVHEFWNPNSGNKVSLYTKVLWADEEAYREAERNGYQRPRLDATRRQEVVEHAL